MADIPDQIVLERHRDLKSVGFYGPVRYTVVALVGAFLVLGLLNAFGQRPAGMDAASARAKLELYAPSRLRGGLLYEGRFTIYARQELKNAQLELAPGWAESMQINTIEPSPVGEGSHDGNLLLTLGHVPKGDVYRLYMEFQVDPTNVAWHRNADVTLYDGDRALLTIHRKVTIFP